MLSCTNRAGQMLAMAAVMGCVGAAAAAQAPKVPTFKAPVHFDVIGNPYGLDAADIIDGNGDPGQDGLPELLVVSAGTDLFETCDYPDYYAQVVVLHNVGGWDQDPGNALTPLYNQLVLPADRIATEAAFAEIADPGGVTGTDIVVTAYDPDTQIGYLYVFVNDGAGDFDTTIHQFPVSGVTLRGMIVRDLDGDGDLDVAAAGSNCESVYSDENKFVVFENTTQTLQNPAFTVHPYDLVIAGNTHPGDIVRGDFWALSPGDSFQDLVTPNPAANSFTKIKNNGNLSFTPTTVGQFSGCDPSWEFVTAVADRFGADQRWDFAAVDPDDLYLRVFRGNGLGGFTSLCTDPEYKDYRYKLYTPQQDHHVAAHGVTSGNLNGDAYPDIAVALRGWTDAGQQAAWGTAAAVLVGKSDGSFRTESVDDHGYIFIGIDSGGAMVQIVDLDDSGFGDIIITNHSGFGIDVWVNSMSTTPGG